MSRRAVCILIIILLIGGLANGLVRDGEKPRELYRTASGGIDNEGRVIGSNGSDSWSNQYAAESDWEFTQRIEVSKESGLLVNSNPFYIRSRNHLELQGEFRVTAYTAGEA